MKRWCARGLAAFALWCASLACASPYTRPSGEPNQGPFDRASVEDWATLSRARAAFDAGDAASAAELVRPLVTMRPDNIGFAIAAQEFELASVAAPERAAKLAELREAARKSMELAPSAARAVLAARLVEDRDLARTYFARALDLDARCAWAYYGLAHLESRAGNWGSAEDDLGRALAIDPFHPLARWMQAGLFARNGRTKSAIAAYEAWIEDCGRDPRVDAHLRIGAELDLATLYVLAHQSDEARNRLAQIDARDRDAVRALCIRAAADQDSGRPNDALYAAQKAHGIDADASLPWIQEAILCQSWLEDPARAELAWKHLLDASEKGGELGDLLLALRARLALERAAVGDAPASKP